MDQIAYNLELLKLNVFPLETILHALFGVYEKGSLLT